MSRELLLTILVIIVLFSQATSSQPLNYKLGLIIQSERVHNLDTGLNYTTIQAAIDAPETSDGHTIFAEEGTYFEHVVVNKSISLIGENKFSTVIDGNGTGDVINIVADSVNVSGFTIISGWGYWWGYFGITLRQVDNCNITGNVIESNEYGVVLGSSSNNTIMGNSVSNNTYGIRLADSNDNTIVGNNMTENGWGILGVADCNNNRIVGNRIKEGYYGIALYDYPCMGNDVFDNSLENTTYGIQLWGSSRNNLSRNNITHSENGIRLIESSDNVLRNNTMADNKYNFGVYGGPLSEFMNDVDTSNTVDRKPIVYLINRQNITIEPQTYPNIGYLAVVNSQNVTIRNLTLKNNREGILLGYTDFSLVYNLSLVSNRDGICLIHSSNNNIMKNNLANNYYGISLTLISDANSISSNNIARNHIGINFHLSSSNRISSNNFIGNDKHIYIHMQVYDNIWDNGYPSGGNYWSDHVGLDLDHDGIGDSDYLIDINNMDHFPLMGMFHSFNTSLGKYVDIISNSTIGDFEYFESNSTIKMYVSGEEGFGFCRVSIPHVSMNVSNISVIIDDGMTPVLCPNYTLYDNGTHRWIYFAYEHSTLEIIIIPEFPSFLILPLFMIITLLVVIVYKKGVKGN